MNVIAEHGVRGAIRCRLTRWRRRFADGRRTDEVFAAIVILEAIHAEALLRQTDALAARGFVRGTGTGNVADPCVTRGCVLWAMGVNQALDTLASRGVTEQKPAVHVGHAFGGGTRVLRRALGVERTVLCVSHDVAGVVVAGRIRGALDQSQGDEQGQDAEEFRRGGRVHECLEGTSGHRVLEADASRMRQAALQQYECRATTGPSEGRLGSDVDIERRRVLVVVPGFPGVDDPLFVPAVSETVAALAQIADVRVLSLFHPTPGGSYPWRNLVVHSCGVPPEARWTRRWFLIWRAVRQAVRMGREMGCDSVLGIGATESGFVAIHAARTLRVPSSVHVSGGELVRRPDIPYGDSRDWTRRRIVDSVMQKAHRILVGSRAQQAMVSLVGGIPLDKVRMSPFGIRDERFQPVSAAREERTESGPLQVIAVAGVLPVKGLQTLVAAVALLRERAICLRIIGAGVEEERLLRLANQWGVADRVEIVGFVEHAQLPEFHRNASLFVQTSHWESQGIALLEAMASGLPVISTPVGIAPEVFEDVGAGRLVPSNNPPALAEAIGDVQRSLKRSSRAALDASAAVLQRYGVDRCAQDLLENVMS